MSRKLTTHEEAGMKRFLENFITYMEAIDKTLKLMGEDIRKNTELTVELIDIMRNHVHLSRCPSCGFVVEISNETEAEKPGGNGGKAQ